MEQHLIPQQISSYEFKLVGEMTLKQFLKAGAGILLAIIINTLPIIGVLKWPIMLIVAGAGIGIAFVPFNDRPLEIWAIAFLKAIYMPTIYLYKRGSRKIGAGIDVFHKNIESSRDEQKIIAHKEKQEKVKEMIDSLPGVQLTKEAEGRAKITVTKVIDDKSEKITEMEMIKEDNWRQNKVNLDLKTERLGATGSAVFGEIPMPDIPDTPNMIVGMVTNKKGSIVEGAIVEIQDKKGNPARVLKTNSLGQFRTTTALATGKYLIISEKEGFDFDRVEVSLEGKIVQPIKIKSMS